MKPVDPPPRLHVLSHASRIEGWTAVIADVATIVGLDTVIETIPVTEGGRTSTQAILDTAAATDGACLILPDDPESSGVSPQPSGVRMLLVPFDRSDGEASVLRPLIQQALAMHIAVEQVHVLSDSNRPAMWEGSGHHAQAWQDELRRRHQVGTAHLRVRSGQPAAVLGALAGQVDLMVACWGGHVGATRAKVLREMLTGDHPPLLLVRTSESTQNVQRTGTDSMAGPATHGSGGRPVDARPQGAVRLPANIQACLFDLDGVLTSTAELHAHAWKACFDRYLARRSERTGEPYRPFDIKKDYDDHVDGKPRNQGARSFLASRGIEIPEGSPADPPDAETVYGITNTKNAILTNLIAARGVRPYPGSARFVQAISAAGLKMAVVSSSANTRAVLASAGLATSFEIVVDAVVANRRHLAGKPAPDTYLAAAADLGVTPAHAAVFEDSQAGVAAGHAGRFGFVVGVDRAGQAAALYASGADVVVSDLADFLQTAPLPDEIQGVLPSASM